jgi:hypothetical protein
LRQGASRPLPRTLGLSGERPATISARRIEAHQPMLTSRKPSNTLVWVSAIVVAIGAVYFGSASCGSYIWHRQAFGFLAAGLAIAAVALPSQALQALGLKAVFLFTLIAGYFVVEAAVAPFYPTSPQSLSEFASLFLQALEFGPCR